jgi:hypothetical protein
VKQADADKLNAYLAGWNGAHAFLNKYVDDHDRLVIGFSRPDDPRQFVGVAFFQCTFLCGPTRWQNCRLDAKIADIGTGDFGLELHDQQAGFLLRCGGPVVVGNSELVIPSD